MMLRLIVLCMAAAATLAAQGPGMFPWWDSPLARDLNLTGQQQQQIRDVVSAARNDMIQLRANAEKAEGELSDLMNSDNPDPVRGNEVIERVTVARADLMRAVSRMSLQLRMVLTLQQWNELQERQRRMRGRFGPGGPRSRMPGESLDRKKE